MKKSLNKSKRNILFDKGMREEKILLCLTPKISVIMPVYNAEKYIKDAINSILNQTEKDFELILIDDCALDSSMDIINRCNDSRIRIIKNQKNEGIAFSRNRGIDVARGKYIALMDDDDIAPMDRFRIELNYMEEHLDIDVVGGIAGIIDENGKVKYIPPDTIYNPNRIYAELLFSNIIANGSTMIRADFIKKNHLHYKDSFLGMEDYKFWTECAIVGKIANINQVLLYWRNTSTNETYYMKHQKEKERKIKYAEIQKEALLAYGFELDQKEMDLFVSVFPEGKKNYVSAEDLNNTYFLLRKMITQAEMKSMKNINELKWVLKKEFALKTQNSEIWSIPL